MTLLLTLGYPQGRIEGAPGPGLPLTRDNGTARVWSLAGSNGHRRGQPCQTRGGQLRPDVPGHWTPRTWGPSRAHSAPLSLYLFRAAADRGLLGPALTAPPRQTGCCTLCQGQPSLPSRQSAGQVAVGHHKAGGSPHFLRSSAPNSPPAPAGTAGVPELVRTWRLPAARADSQASVTVTV